MKKILIIIICVMTLIFSASCGDNKSNKETGGAAYMNISQEEAKELMDTQENYIILDVRTQEEFDEKHIPGAILIPDYEIEEKAEKILTDKNQLILVYCRSGRRSKNASEILEKLGYTYIREFGGIIDWKYQTES
ncbi:MAG: rhodanese-like domain-containing protein [Ruminococcus sp.]|nr:rhodanese-like domain-containing protein [Ruminococcus sp.]